MIYLYWLSSIQIQATLFISVFLFLSGCVTQTSGDKQFKSEPKNPSKAYYDLGINYMQKGRFDLAEVKLQRSISQKKTPEALNALAILYEETHDNVLSEETYEKLIRDYPEYGRGFINYNIFLCKYDRQPQISNLAASMASRGSEMAALGQIVAGDCALSKGRVEDASRFYNNALIHEQYSLGALLPLAEISFNNGYTQDAKEKLATIHNYIGYTPQSLILAIALAKETGDAVSEKKMKRELRARFPNSEEARQANLK